MFQNITVTGTYNQGFIGFESKKGETTWYRLTPQGKVDLSQYKDGETIVVSGQITGSGVSKGIAYLEMDAWFCRRPEEHSADLVIAGRLGGDPELRHTSNGSPVANFSVATDLSKDETVWVSVAVWGRQGENASEYLHKGDPVLVIGFPGVESWTSQQGQERSKVKLTARMVKYLPKPKSSAPRSSAPVEEPSEIPF